MSTARQIIVAEVSKYLDCVDYVHLGSVQQIENDLRIWEWGKAALLGDSTPLGIQRQVKFRARIQEGITQWAALAPMDDDDFQAMDKVISKLAEVEREIIRRIYIHWESTHDAPKAMGMPRHKFMKMQGMALSYIKGAQNA